MFDIRNNLKNIRTYWNDSRKQDLSYGETLKLFPSHGVLASAFLVGTATFMTGAAANAYVALNSSEPKDILFYGAAALLCGVVALDTTESAMDVARMAERRAIGVIDLEKHLDVLPQN
tara:strand:+ start:1222 stop:1575 length:354 start_codon:yes stop_codon:yes gene_type:complete